MQRCEMIRSSLERISRPTGPMTLIQSVSLATYQRSAEKLKFCWSHKCQHFVFLKTIHTSNLRNTLRVTVVRQIFWVIGVFQSSLESIETGIKSIM